MIRALPFLFILVSGYEAIAQDRSKVKSDSLTLLNEVIVHAYAHDRPLSEVPAAIGLITTKTLERFNNTSLLPAVNTIPGVRMEERSPGSYRFAIRGSSLRSPFGVRNVKMYWNGLPLTDGGGNTYLNLLDLTAVGGAEIIKGPGASLYGAGTGGVVLLNSPQGNRNQLQFSAMGGSYGLQRYQVNSHVSTEKINGVVNYAHQESNGYRLQTAMRRDAVNTQWKIKLTGKSTLSTSLFYTDLYYQTPGGLTQAQYNANPRQARPATATLRSAIDQKAAVSNKTVYGGSLYDYDWNDKWSTQFGIYGSFTDFINPTINNYEKRKEYNWGGRTVTNYRLEKENWKGKLTFGGEYQQFYSTLADYVNTKGVQGIIQTDDRLYSTFSMAFAQAETELPHHFFLTLGASANFLKYRLHSITPADSLVTRNFSPVTSPRIALLRKLGEQISLYGSVSSGFSPPTLAEVRPSYAAARNSKISPEQGTNYELGIRGTLLRQVQFDFTAYDFELHHTIVVQQQINGQDFFINAGGTRQKGLESMVSWTPRLQSGKFLSALRLWGSYTLNHYRFLHYVKNSGTVTPLDYSGNRLTGVPPNAFVGGADVRVIRTVYANLTVNYVDKIPVNDAGSQNATAYFLAGMRLGYQNLPGKKVPLEVFAGVDNVTNRIYSLGNDLNAIGGRYYNAATGRNFYFGVKVGLVHR